MQLYADEDFPLPVVEELRRLGHDVITAQQDGRMQRLIRSYWPAPMHLAGQC